MKTRLDSIYKSAVDTSKADLVEAESVAITTDASMTINVESYITVTETWDIKFAVIDMPERHTAENIASHLKNIA